MSIRLKADAAESVLAYSHRRIPGSTAYIVSEKPCHWGLMTIRTLVMDDEFKDSCTLLASVSISLFTGFAGAWLAPRMRQAYASMHKPVLAPPEWIFGPIWIFLYILMGIASYKVYRSGRDRKEVRDALFYYGAQLVFNLMWPVLFFRFALSGVALLDAIILAALVIITAMKFSRIDTVAGILMVPCMLWVIYGVVLNYGLLL